MNYLSIIILAVILIFGLIGLFRGFFKSTFGLAATIITIVAVYFFTPALSRAIIDHTGIDEQIHDKVYGEVEEYADRTVMKGITDTRDRMDTAQSLTRADREDFISTLPIDSGTIGRLNSDDNEDIYEALGVTDVFEYVAWYVTYRVINMISSVLTFVLLRVLFTIILITVNKAVEDVAIVGGLDRAGGFIAGLLAGVFAALIVFTVFSIAFTRETAEMVQASRMLQFIEAHNLILDIFNNITGIIFQ